MRARIRTVDSGVGLGVTPVYFVEVKRWWQREWRRVSQVTEYADAYRIALEYVAPQLTEVTPVVNVGSVLRTGPKDWREYELHQNATSQGTAVGAGTAHAASQQDKNANLNQYAKGYSYKVDQEMAASLPTEETPPAPGSPWPGHGGYYVCTVYGRHLIMRDRFSGVMASVAGPTFDLHTDKPFSNSHKEGKQNTRQQLMRGPQRFPAARLCAGLILPRLGGRFDDYYLPARAELQIAWAVAPELFERDRLYATSTLTGGDKMFVVDGTSGAAYEVSCSSSDLVVVPFRSEPA